MLYNSVSVSQTAEKSSQVVYNLATHQVHRLLVATVQSSGKRNRFHTYTLPGASNQRASRLLFSNSSGCSRMNKSMFWVISCWTCFWQLKTRSFSRMIANRPYP